MPLSRIQAILCAFSLVCAALVAGQEFPPISATNLARLKPIARIDFADFPGELQIGWFEADADGGEFIVFDQDGRIYRVSPAGIEDSWTYIEPGSGQLFSLIDAAYIYDEPQLLYLLDGAYFINEQPLPAGYEPVAMAPFIKSLYVEAIDADGRTVFMHYAKRYEGGAWELIDDFFMPASDPQQPAVRIGRVSFPDVLYSSLADSELIVFRYPYFMASMGRDYRLEQGPAVVGAVNESGRHFAWSDPASARLNLLDLDTGENRVVAELGGAYAQYHLLTADASAILVVNLDFAPEVFAWDVKTGERHDIGAYRECQRIPDKVALSAEGRALIIGCDTGLEIWRVENREES